MRGKFGIIRWVALLAVAAAVYWQQARRSGGDGSPGDPPPSAPDVRGAEKVNGYDRLTGARLVEHEHNDGDSFVVEAGEREFQLRLYFVDAPETYLSDRYESQRRRVAEQAREMGGISVEEAVAVGKRARAHALDRLRDGAFTVYTYWERVYDSDRYYGFVELPGGDWLGTELVELGLARIHTKGPGSKANPVPTPEGRSFHRHRDRLYELERAAKRAGRGAWGR